MFFFGGLKAWKANNSWKELVVPMWFVWFLLLKWSNLIRHIVSNGLKPPSTGTSLLDSIIFIFTHGACIMISYPNILFGTCVDESDCEEIWFLVVLDLILTFPDFFLAQILKLSTDLACQFCTNSASIITSKIHADKHQVWLAENSIMLMFSCCLSFSWLTRTSMSSTSLYHACFLFTTDQILYTDYSRWSCWLISCWFVAHPHSTTLPFETSSHLHNIRASTNRFKNDWWFFIGGLQTGKLFFRP